jgi:hypothetical protein
MQVINPSEEFGSAPERMKQIGDGKFDIQFGGISRTNFCHRLSDSIFEPLMAKQFLLEPEEESASVTILAQPLKDLMLAPIEELDRLSPSACPFFPLSNMLIPLVHEPLLFLYTWVLAINW